MSKFSWFAIGLGLGALTVVQLRDNPKAQDALDGAVSAAKDFGNSIAEGFSEREAELNKPATKSTPTKKS
jgi:hypothetical protein